MSAATRAKAMQHRREQPVEHPVIEPEPVFANHAEWAEKAVTTFDCEGGLGSRWQRAVYNMQGHQVYLETFFPWNVFKEVTTSMCVASFNVTANSEEMKLAEKFGGKWEPGYYAEKGYGWPRFYGEDCTEKCWNFLEAHNKAWAMRKQAS